MSRLSRLSRLCSSQPVVGTVGRASGGGRADRGGGGKGRDEGGKSRDDGGRGKGGKSGEKGKNRAARTVLKPGVRGQIVTLIAGRPSGFIKRFDARGEPDVFFDLEDCV